MKENYRSVDEYYNGVADDYHNQYERQKLHDFNREYPANYFRLQIMLNSFIKKNIHHVIDVGVGEGTPLTTLAKSGIDVCGFDLSDEMVKKAKNNMKKNGLNPEKIFWGDIQDNSTYMHSLKNGQFDGLICMGVMPHIDDDDLVLDNISSIVKPGGSVFIEFRNKLFSLFTFNRYTKDFILNDLLKDVDHNLKNIVEKELNERLHTNLPPIRNKIEGTNSIGYDAIPSKFHNPFEVVELFKKHNFEDIKLHWYHYHPAMPYLKNESPQLFHDEAINLEHESSNWRGYFLCSAFVVEATNGK